MLEIRRDDPFEPRVAALLREHLESVEQVEPSDVVYVLGPEELRAPDITLWSAWHGPELVGCCALKELEPEHGEIKSMRTSEAHLRKGVGAALLGHMVEVARRRSYRRLSLETGSQDAYVPARSLYARFGFVLCEPYGEYTEDPNSVFMTLALA